MLRATAMEAEGDNRFSGYTVAYDRDEIQFPVYVLLTVGAALLFAAVAEHRRQLCLLQLSSSRDRKNAASGQSRWPFYRGDSGFSHGGPSIAA